jgi:hypothetical protein
MPSATVNRMELFVRKSFTKAIRTREKNYSYERQLNKSLEELSLKIETRTKNLNNEIRQLGVNLKKAGVKDVTASVSLPSTAPSSRSSTPDTAARSTTTSLPLLHACPSAAHASQFRRASRCKASEAWASKNTAATTSQSGHDTSSTTRGTSSKYSDRSVPKSSTTFRSSLRKSPKRSANSRVSFRSNTCLVTESGRRECQHFPCLLPSSYNHVGYESDTEKITTRPVSMSATTQRRMFRALEAKSSRRPQRSTLHNKSKLREDGLHKLVNHMRWKNELTKPPEWVLNYGKPTPLRKILKPARATALEIS